MITGETTSGVVADEWALLRLSWLYARAMDRNEPATLESIFVDDALLEGDWFKVQGLSQIKQLPANLHERYVRMMHTVHNQTVEIEGDTAEGETYCVAHHILDGAARGGPTVFDMGIRYHSRWIRSEGRWRFTYRHVTLDWSEIRAARRTLS
jgi:hypothetical protein